MKAAAITASGLTPLDYVLSVMRDEKGSAEIRLEAAKAAASYVHPRLSEVEYSGPNHLGRVFLRQAGLMAASSGSTEPH